MATSAHSTLNTPAPQVSNFSDLTARKYRVYISDGEVYAEAVLQPFIRATWHRQLYTGRVRTAGGRMGARQRERAQGMLSHAIHLMTEALIAAGWTHRTDAGGTFIWEQPQEPAQEPQEPAQEPQEPAQEPQEPAQEPQQPAQEPQQPAQEPQQPADSLLPWQGGELVSATSRRWRLAVAGLAVVEMYHHAHSGRYEWLITPPNRLTFLAASGGPGYSCYSRAERAMLLALHRVLHPSPCLPASLPPCEGAISATRRGE